MEWSIDRILGVVAIIFGQTKNDISIVLKMPNLSRGQHFKKRKEKKKEKEKKSDGDSIANEK